MARKRSSLNSLFQRAEPAPADEPAQKAVESNKEPVVQPEQVKKEAVQPVEKAAETVAETTITESDSTKVAPKAAAAEKKVVKAAKAEFKPARKEIPPKATESEPRWDYRVLQLSYERLEDEMGEYWDYTATFSDGTRAIGIPAALQRFGQKGWELINVVPTFSANFGGQGESYAMEIRAIFKKPM